MPSVAICYDIVACKFIQYLKKISRCIGKVTKNLQMSKEQEARALLRLGFLQTVQVLSGRQAQVVTAEGNTLTGKLIGTDRDSNLVSIENLGTPAGKIEQGIVRFSDIDHMVLERSKI